jgi:hypothetical protein
MKKLLVFFGCIYLLTFSLASAQNLIGVIETTNDRLYKESIGGDVLIPDLNNSRIGHDIKFTSDHFYGKFRTYKLIYISSQEAVLEAQSNGRYSEKLYINRAEKKFTFCSIQQFVNDTEGDKYGFSVSTIQGSFK